MPAGKSPHVSHPPSFPLASTWAFVCMIDEMGPHTIVTVLLSWSCDARCEQKSIREVGAWDLVVGFSGLANLEFTTGLAGTSWETFTRARHAHSSRRYTISCTPLPLSFSSLLREGLPRTQSPSLKFSGGIATRKDGGAKQAGQDGMSPLRSLTLQAP